MCADGAPALVRRSGGRIEPTSSRRRNMARTRTLLAAAGLAGVLFTGLGANAASAHDSPAEQSPQASGSSEDARVIEAENAPADASPAGDIGPRASAPDCVVADRHPEGNHPGYDHVISGNHEAVIVTNTCNSPKRVKVVLAWHTDFPCVQFQEGDAYLFEWFWGPGEFDGLESC
jgi:hypothetical protein